MKVFQKVLLALFSAALLLALLFVTLHASGYAKFVSAIPGLLITMTHTFNSVLHQGQKSHDNYQTNLRPSLDDLQGDGRKPSIAAVSISKVAGDGTEPSDDDPSDIQIVSHTKRGRPIFITTSQRIRQHIDVRDYTELAECRSKGFCIPNKYIADHKVVLPGEHDGRMLRSIAIRHTGTATAYADERFIDQVFVYDICLYILVAGQERANVSHNSEAWCMCGQKGATQGSFPTYGDNNVISFPGDGIFVPAGTEIRFGMGGAFMRWDGSSDDDLKKYYLGCQKDGYPGVPSGSCRGLADLGHLEINMELEELPDDMSDLAVYQMMRVPYVDVFLKNRNSPHEGHNFNIASEIGAIYEYVSTTPAFDRWNSVLYRLRGGVWETLLDQQQQRAQPVAYRMTSLTNGDVPMDLGSLRDMPIVEGDTVGIYCDTLRYWRSIAPFNDCAYWVAVRVYPTDSSSDAVFRSIDTIRQSDREAFCSVVGPRSSADPLYTDAYSSKQRCLELLSNETAVDGW